MTTTQTPNTTAATFTIVNEMSGPTEFSVHAAGCKDLKGKTCNSMWDTTAATAADAVATEVEFFQSQEQGWEADHFRIMPCAAKISRSA